MAPLKSDVYGIIRIENIIRYGKTGGLETLHKLRPDAVELETAPHRSVRVYVGLFKRKISCMVMTLPSMPVISWRLTSFRLPSARRETVNDHVYGRAM